MKTKTTRLLATLLALVLVVGIIPMTALAAEQPVQGDPSTVTETYARLVPGQSA